MSFLSWLSPDDETKKHEEQVAEAKKKLKNAHTTHEEVRKLIEELEKERRRDHYAEMIAGSLMPRRDN